MKYILCLMFSLSCYSNTLTYTDDVKPIIKNRCSACHNGTNELPNLLDYDEVYKKKELILKKLTSREMPHFIGEQMTESERDTIIEWIKQGAVK